MSHETEVHRVYTEQTGPVLNDEYPLIISCENSGKNYLETEEDGGADEIIVTIIDEDVTCPDCLGFIK
jgi:hypothetical protein